MTKTFTLLLSPNYRCYYAEEYKNATFKPPALCRDFVRWASHTDTLAQEINVTVSTDENPGATKIFVAKQGFYRWYWSDALPFGKRSSQKYSLDGGIPPHTENTLNRFFPNANTQGMDEPHPLWLTITLPHQPSLTI